MPGELNNLTTEELGKLFPLIIADYNPGWAGMFLMEKRKITRVVGPEFITRIEHKPENPLPHMMFTKGYSKNGISGQIYHVHIRFPGDWDEIKFRDFLIRNPEVALVYADLKKDFQRNINITAKKTRRIRLLLSKSYSKSKIRINT
jgi:GrpB-like predicted nucleotidyltransferase (UPF0157 family)